MGVTFVAVYCTVHSWWLRYLTLLILFSAGHIPCIAHLGFPEQQPPSTGKCPIKIRSMAATTYTFKPRDAWVSTGWNGSV
jgi:hypothetical protein